MPETSEGKEITRREFLKKVAAGTASIALGNLLSACENIDKQAAATSESASAKDQPNQTKEKKNSLLLKRLYGECPHQARIIQAAQSFMSQDPKSPERVEMETSMMKRLAENANVLKPGDVLLALQACSTVQARIQGMEMFWRMNQTGVLKEYGIEPLPQGEKDWALANQIDPRTLLMAEIAFPIAFDLLKANQEQFLEAVPEQDREKLSLASRIPNPGVMAKLMMTETQFIATSETGKKLEPINRFWGLVNIGNAPALSQTNTSKDYFPTAEFDIKWIAQFCEQNTGLPYLENVDNLPGSLRRHFDSGGAIGPQFMPINARLFMEWYNHVNQKPAEKYPPPNPFDPVTGTVMTYLFLASEFYARQGHIDENGQPLIKRGTKVREGYVAGNDEKMQNALLKWNFDVDQVNSAIAAGKDYYDRFWLENDPREELAQSIKN